MDCLLQEAGLVPGLVSSAATLGKDVVPFPLSCVMASLVEEAGCDNQWC